MRISSLALLAVAPLASASKVLKHDFDVIRGSKPIRDAPHLVKRDESYFEAGLDNMVTYYQINITVGTPGQEMAVLIDTGSSDLWLYDSGEEYCSELATATVTEYTASTDLAYGTTPSAYVDPDFGTCGLAGGFNPDKSKSFHQNSTEFLIKYEDNTTATGYWAYDTVDIGGTKIANLTFALANFTNSTPVFGIGLPGAETTYGEYFVASENYTYENLPQKLAKEGIINTAAYSLFLNDAEADVGSVLFGGVDHAKYEGNLTTVKVVDWYGGLQITLSDIYLQEGDKSAKVAEGGYLALLDSGTTLTYMPENLYNNILEFTNATFDENIEEFVYDCDIVDDTYITFNFTGAIIQVPLRTFTFEQFGKCINGIEIYDYTDIDFFILGDNFLRNAYIVYDLDNLEISLAPAKYTDEEDIEEIDTDGVPGATKAAYYSETFTVSAYAVTAATELTWTSATPVATAASKVKDAASSTTTKSSSSKGDAAIVGGSVSSLLGLLAVFLI